MLQNCRKNETAAIYAKVLIIKGIARQAEKTCCIFDFPL